MSQTEQAREAISKSTLPAAAKILLLGLRQGPSGFEVPNDVAGVIVDELFKLTRIGEPLKNHVGALMRIAETYATAHASPLVSTGVGRIIDQLGARLRSADANKANARKAAITFLGGSANPRLSTKQASSAPSFKPWAMQASK